MGVELEHLGKFEEAIVSLEKAKKVSELHLNQSESEMVQIIEKNIIDINQKLEFRNKSRHHRQ